MTIEEIVHEAVSPFQCVHAVKEKLLCHGFQELSYGEEWKLTPGQAYVMEHHGSTLFAFSVGNKYQSGDMLRLAAAHTDYPTLRIKPNPDMKHDVYAQVNVEVYGGPILNTWLDRPLGVAGRVIVKSEELFSPKVLLYRSDRAIMTIPNLAIHMNREVNKGIELNKQIDLIPIVDLLPEEQTKSAYFMNFLAEELQEKEDDILDFELYAYCMEEACSIGPKETLLSAPRLDNQTSVCSLIQAIQEGTREHGVNLIALFDHEEVGNKSKQGAASLMLRDLVQRILRNLGNTEAQIDRAIYEAMLLSVDVAHGLHPNKSSKMDVTNHPVLGGGFCIKQACSQSYATDAEAIAVLEQICQCKNIPYQVFVNRSDMAGGGTLGSVASTLLPIKTVDIGIPLLAMHSARELMSRTDLEALTDAVTWFFRL